MGHRTATSTDAFCHSRTQNTKKSDPIPSHGACRTDSIRMHMGFTSIRRKGSRRARRAFTLVELLMAVAIIGVLSTLALVGYRKAITRARLGEATSMAASVASSQERYRGEFGTYLNVSTTLGHKGNTSTLCPTPEALKKKSWAPAACAGANNWIALAVQNAGALYFGYSTTSGAAGTPPSDAIALATGNVAWPTGAQLTRDWYVVSAAADTDGNGRWATVVASSWTNDILVDDND
jgi:type IV pilus assembly protein PilA